MGPEQKKKQNKNNVTPQMLRQKQMVRVIIGCTVFSGGVATITEYQRRMAGEKPLFTPAICLEFLGNLLGPAHAARTQSRDRRRC